MAGARRAGAGGPGTCLRRGASHASSVAFDDWLGRAVEAEPGARDRELMRSAEAPAARQVHPREEHLLPLMVMAGAAGNDRGRVAYRDTFGGARISAVHFEAPRA